MLNLFAEGRNTAPIRLSLLGSLRIESEFYASNGEEKASTIERFQTQKTAALLAFLALWPTRSHGREFLVDLFWPDTDPEKGRRSLRVALTSLRRQLEPPGVPTNMVLIADRNTVRLNYPGGVWTDVAEFETLAKTLDSENSPDTEALLLDRALALYDGPLLPGFYEDWVLRERERLVDLFRSLLLRRALLAQKMEAIILALDCARRAVNLEEDREVSGSDICEEAHITLIRLLTQAGRHDDAQHQYETLERRLRERGHKSPSTRARTALHSASSYATTSTSTRTPATVVLSPPITPDKITPQRPSPRLRLPLILSRFFGRGPEMDQVNYALFFSSSRLITLTGPGGAGKTRFAVEFARRYAVTAKTSAVYFAPLADVDSATQIWTAIAQALGIERSRQAQTLRPQIIQRLLETQQTESGEENPCLLILDNFETLVDIGAPLVAGLLEDIPSLQILVTSRRRLSLPGEQEVPIGPLPVPALPGTPERLMEWPSVQLFVDRAQTARSDFQITPRSSESIANLCCRLDGIPLALELTAAWAGVLSPTQMLQRVDSQLLDEAGPPLAHHRARRSERHRTLRAAIDSSFSLLAPELKEAFIRLAVFRGGWTLAAAEYLLEGIPSPTAEILSRLRERSLILAETATDGESVRFRMLETLREFALEQQDREQADYLRNRTAHYFTEYAVRHCAQENNQQSEALSRIDADYPNLVEAIEWLTRSEIATEEAVVQGLRLADSLGWYWLLRGFTQRGCDWFRSLLSTELLPDLPQEGRTTYFNARISALISGAQLAMRADSNEEAKKWGEEALALSCEGYGTISQSARAYNTLGMVAMAQGDYPKAQSLYEKALQCKQKIGDSCNSATILSNLGLVCWYQGDFPEAERYFNICLQEDRASGEREGEARDLANLGLIACIQSDLPLSQTFLEASLTIRREIKDQHGIVNVLGNLGEVFFQQNKITEAKEVLSESLALSRSLKDSQQVAYALGILGMIMVEQQEFSQASDLLGECVTLFIGLEDRYQIQNALEAYASFAYATASWMQKKNPILTAKAKSAYECAVRFWAAGDRLRAKINVPLLDKDRILREEKTSATREILGVKDFERQQNAGTNLSFSDLIAETKISY
jgi:predicted ATPase/DNA-binding SARP family transcriptional activator/Tfp pilus assembly protein PilF